MSDRAAASGGLGKRFAHSSNDASKRRIIKPDLRHVSIELDNHLAHLRGTQERLRCGRMVRPVFGDQTSRRTANVGSFVRRRKRYSQKSEMIKNDPAFIA